MSSGAALFLFVAPQRVQTWTRTYSLPFRSTVFGSMRPAQSLKRSPGTSLSTCLLQRHEEQWFLQDFVREGTKNPQYSHKKPSFIVRNCFLISKSIPYRNQEVRNADNLRRSFSFSSLSFCSRSPFRRDATCSPLTK